MSISSHINSIFDSLCYRIGDILIDPGDEWEGFRECEAVFLTHTHFDHIYGLNRVIELNPNVIIYTNEFGAKALDDPKLNMSRYHESDYILNDPERIEIVTDGEGLTLNHSVKAKAIFTPGHNPSCITWLIGDNLFTGDSYIPGIKVVTNLPYANKDAAFNSLSKILSQSRNKHIFPGHKI